MPAESPVLAASGTRTGIGSRLTLLDFLAMGLDLFDDRGNHHKELFLGDGRKRGCNRGPPFFLRRSSRQQNEHRLIRTREKRGRAFEDARFGAGLQEGCHGGGRLGGHSGGNSVSSKPRLSPLICLRYSAA